MIIYNKDKQLKVTAGAYKSIFKPLGWTTEKPVESTQKSFNSGIEFPEIDDEEDPQDEILHKDDDPASEEDLSERPLSDLSLEELRALAKQYNVDITGMKLKRDIRNAIRDAMNEEN